MQRNMRPAAGRRRRARASGLLGQPPFSTSAWGQGATRPRRSRHWAKSFFNFSWESRTFFTSGSLAFRSSRYLKEVLGELHDGDVVHLHELGFGADDLEGLDVQVFLPGIGPELGFLGGGLDDDLQVLGQFRPISSC